MQALPIDLCTRLLSHCDAQALGRVLGASKELRRMASADALWQPLCQSLGIRATHGSNRPGARTYISWAAVWRDSRCANCYALYHFKVNLDGGSTSASTYHGAKIPLCQACAARASECYHRMSETKTLGFRLLPRLVARYGLHVALTCGNNVPISESTARKKRHRSA